MTLHLFEKRVSISTYFLFSLLVHLALLTFLLSLPLYMRGAITSDFLWGYFVSEEGGAQKMPAAQMPKKAGVKAEEAKEKGSMKAVEKIVKPKAKEQKKEEVIPPVSEKSQKDIPSEVQETAAAEEKELIPAEKEAQPSEVLQAESGIPQPETSESAGEKSGQPGKEGDGDKQLESAEKTGREIIGRPGASLPISGAGGAKPGMPSRENGQGIASIISGDTPGAQKDIIASIITSQTKEIKKPAPPVGIPLPPAIILRDIRIEVLIKGQEPKGFSAGIKKRPHPMEKGAGGKLKDVRFMGETTEIKDGEEIKIKRIFVVANAEKGIYNFFIGNKGDGEYSADVALSIYEGKEKANTKKFGSVKLTPHSSRSFKFMLPEAVFWDDDEYFTGRIEDSNSITKFKHETDLIWREEKDY